MGFGQSISTVYRNYANFEGRASRSEFWWYYLFYVIIYLVTLLIDQALPVNVFPQQDLNIGGQIIVLPTVKFGVLTVIWVLANIIPLLAVGCRRLHDTARSGWWLLWCFLLNCLCFAGSIILIVFWCLAPTPGDNRYGPQPAS